MLLVPPSTPGTAVRQLTLVAVPGAGDLPLRAASTVHRRGGRLLALAYARRGPDDRAALELCFEAPPDRADHVVACLGRLVDVVEVRRSRARGAARQRGGDGASASVAPSHATAAGTCAGSM